MWFVIVEPFWAAAGFFEVHEREAASSDPGVFLFSVTSPILRCVPRKPRRGKKKTGRENNGKEGGAACHPDQDIQGRRASRHLFIIMVWLCGLSLASGRTPFSLSRSEHVCVVDQHTLSCLSLLPKRIKRVAAHVKETHLRRGAPAAPSSQLRAEDEKWEQQDAARDDTQSSLASPASLLSCFLTLL